MISTSRTPIDLICQNFGETEQSLRLKSRRPGRKALALIATVNCGLPHPPVAQWLEVSDWAVSKLIRTVRELLRTSRDFRKRVEFIRHELA